MRLGRVVGQVVCTVKDPDVSGYRLFVVQPLDEALAAAGKPLVAVDGMRCAGVGDLIYMAEKRDAAIALGDKPAVDATIIGYVDEVAVEREADGPLEIRKG